MDVTSRTATQNKRSKEPDALTEIDSVLEKFSLLRVHIGDYLVIVRSGFDLFVAGEPYIATMILLNLWSKHFIARVWNRTVMTGSVGSKKEFEEACKTVFDQGTPCLGCPYDDENSESGKDYIISQTPFPRKISNNCQDFTGKDVGNDVFSCPECLALSEPNSTYDFSDKAGKLTKNSIYSDTHKYEDANYENDIEMETPDPPAMISNEPDTDLKESECRDDMAIEDNDEDWNGNDDIGENSEENEGKTSQPGSLIKCEWCDRRFKSFNWRHYKTFHFGGEFGCAECPFKAKFAKDLVGHMVKTNHTKDVLCPNCTSCREDSQISIDRHPLQEIESHYRYCVTHPYKCKWCEFVTEKSKKTGYYEKQKMSEHLRKQHYWGPFRCYHCDYVGNFASDIVQHMAEADHENEGHVECPSCKERIEGEAISTHYEGCVNKVFKLGPSRRRMKINKHKCQYCDFSSSQGNMSYHLQVKHHFGKFKCPIMKDALR